MVAKTVTLIFIGLLTFCVGIISNLPASLFSKKINNVTQSVNGLQVGKIFGTIWNGSIEARYNEFPVSLVSWDASLFHLIFGQLNLGLSINAAGLEGKSELLFLNDSIKLSNLRLEINSSFINEATESFGLELSESFTVRISEIYVSDNWFSQINGKIAWPGGSIELVTPLERLRVQLPMLSGIAKMEGEEAKLYMYSNSEELMILSLGRSGWAKAEVNQRFFEITQLSLPGLDSETGKDPAFTFEEKIL